MRGTSPIQTKSHFNPRPPCGGRQMYPDTLPSSSVISIHAPRAGGDGKKRWSSSHNLKFQSTPPVRGATNAVRVIYVVCTISIHAPRAGGDGFPALSLAGFQISIHAPRAGGDPTAAPLPPLAENFNPRPPCGGRLKLDAFALRGMGFQSTPPVRGATNKGNTPGGKKYISIHAPRAGGDQFLNPLLSVHKISIHAPRAGGDSSFVGDGVEIEISIHAPRAGGDNIARIIKKLTINFNPRPPCGGRRKDYFCYES